MWQQAELGVSLVTKSVITLSLSLSLCVCSSLVQSLRTLLSDSRNVGGWEKRMLWQADECGHPDFAFVFSVGD